MGEERIRCLNLGADDCVVKPFSFHELVARCMGILRRRKEHCCTRAELLHEVWHMVPETATNIVDVYVNYLRKKLAAAGLAGEMRAAVIKTLRGTGYWLSDERIKTESIELNAGHELPDDKKFAARA